VGHGVLVAAGAARLPGNLVPLERQVKVIQVVAQQVVRLMGGLEVAVQAQRADLPLWVLVIRREVMAAMAVPLQSVEAPLPMQAAVAVAQTAQVLLPLLVGLVVAVLVQILPQ
jgi:hypothetical protein